MSAAYPDWRAIHTELTGRGVDALSAEELDLLGESLFWLDDPDASIAALGKAHTAHVQSGDHARAAMAAWQLFYDHALVGESAPANGWLERARRHALEVTGSSADGFLAIAEADAAAAAGIADQALAHAQRAVGVARDTGDPDLSAMALQALGRSLISRGEVEEGLAALDEAMVAVINGEVTPVFTGWVYCNVLSACHDLADLRRAVQWSDAANRWCEGLQDGKLYRGICRLHAVELEALRGPLARAAELAQQARDELTSHDPRYAGEAHYLIGELHRRAGELDLAEEAFTTAHQLGRPPQPGLALVRIAQGRVDSAIGALQLALDPPPPSPLQRLELRGALVHAHLGRDDVTSARATVASMQDEGDTTSDYLDACIIFHDAVVLLAEGDPAGACRQARDAAARFHELGLAYDEARARAVCGHAALGIDQDDTAELELRTAAEVFQRLGAEPEAGAAEALLTGESASPLSSRELEVLRIVARGRTNKEVAAELYVSEHTVARHLSNIYTKLGVGSRAAATAYAHEHALL